MRIKRVLTAASLSLLLLFGGHDVRGAGRDGAPRGVSSDAARLRAAIVLTIGDNIFRSSEMGAARHPFFVSGLPRGTMREQAALISILRRSGVRVLDVRDLLQSAITSARRRGRLAPWLRETFPATAREAVRRIDEIDADSVLARRDEHFYLSGAGGALDPLFPGISSMYWSRDFAVSTPKGIVIGNGQAYGRALENAIARLMFEHADELKGFPVVFDSAREGVMLDGGDVIVLDERTLLVGVNNRTSLDAAPKLARKLGMEVLAVQMPPADKPSGLTRQLLHLDSMFSLVGAKRVLAVPYFLEKRYDESNPVAKVLLGVAAQMDRIARLQPERELGKSDDVRLTARLTAQVGWVTRHAAGTGAATPLGIKLVDYFRARGYEVTYVGGEQGDLAAEKYAVERAMYELRWQGANVVQLAPGRVVAFEHNVHTNEALRRAGVRVVTFPGELLSIRNGGPHCLVMPLVRGD